MKGHSPFQQSTLLSHQQLRCSPEALWPTPSGAGQSWHLSTLGLPVTPIMPVQEALCGAGSRRGCLHSVAETLPLAWAFP